MVGEFIGTGIGVAQIVAMIGYGIFSIFNGMRITQFGDTPFSILDVFIAIMLFDLIAWYLIRLATKRDSGVDEEMDNEDKGDMGETGFSSGETDPETYSGEILHEYP